MPTAGATTKQPRARRRPILPMRLDRIELVHVQREKTQALWPWYMAPFVEPDISPECKAFVLGNFEPADEDERQLLLVELSQAGTVRGDANMAIIQAPGAIASERGYYRRKGFRIISPVEGEPNDMNQELNIYPPQMEDNPQFGSIGIKTIVVELERRQKWALAQIDAKIADAGERAREGDGTQRRYYRAIVAALRNRKRQLEDGIPTAQELDLFFTRFERLRMQSRQDAKMRAESILQTQVDNMLGREQSLANEIAGMEGSWDEEAS